MSETVYITVDNHSRIPFVNMNGPIVVPISVYKTVADNLQQMGFIVHIHENLKRDHLGRIFEPAKEGQTVEALVNPVDDAVEPHDHEPVVGGDKPEVTHQDGEVEPETEEESSDEEDDNDDEENFTIEQYAELTKRQLETLVKESPEVPEEEYKGAGSLNKTKLLEIVAKYLVKN